MDDKELKELELYFNTKYVRIEDCDEKMEKNENFINKLQSGLDEMKDQFGEFMIKYTKTSADVDHIKWLTATALAGIITALIKLFIAG